MARLLIARQDGGVSLMEVLTGTPAKAVAKWAAAHGTPVAVRQVDDAFAFDRRWRAAYRYAGGTAVIDVAAARDVRMGELLAVRDRLMDVVRSRIEQAEEAGDMVRVLDLQAKRRTLRLLTGTLDAQLANVKTVEELAAFRPAILDEDEL